MYAIIELIFLGDGLSVGWYDHPACMQLEFACIHSIFSSLQWMFNFWLHLFDRTTVVFSLTENQKEQEQNLNVKKLFMF